MKIKISILIAVLLLSAGGCITQFIPETDELQEILVVEGLVTNQDEPAIVRLSKSMPLGKKSSREPLSGCIVTVTDDSGNNYELPESVSGTYSTAPGVFRGVAGRKYVLHIKTNNSTTDHYSYESVPVEMIPVPPIDTIFYEKVKIIAPEPWDDVHDGCQIYLNTTDPTGKCKFYRWDYNETWEIRLPFSAPVNHTCWISGNSTVINIKSTNSLSENRVSRYPLNYISDQTDRLKVKYSMFVNQYSLTQDEFDYWEKLRNVAQEVGSLYDIIPASIPGNIYCIENTGQKVLGFFSVSAKTSKRIFIKDIFNGIINPYLYCIDDTIIGRDPKIPDLNISNWILEQDLNAMPPYTITTDIWGCADCTVRGSNIEPEFWHDDQK
ncbi:MAG: DUF4249 domain-containing protein [Bacteroidales bacterium]